jgi:hypothetical protein
MNRTIIGNLMPYELARALQVAPDARDVSDPEAAELMRRAARLLEEGDYGAGTLPCGACGHTVIL